MKVIIRHRATGASAPTVQTVEVFATSDLACCELAYLHTCKNSLTALLGCADYCCTEPGDVVELVDDDTSIPRRFLLVSVEEGIPSFQRWH